MILKTRDGGFWWRSTLRVVSPVPGPMGLMSAVRLVAHHDSIGTLGVNKLEAVKNEHGQSIVRLGKLEIER